MLRLLPDGRVFSERAISKIRRLERGWHHCVAELEAHGAATFSGGVDVEAAERRARRWAEMQAASRFLQLLRAGQGNP